MKHDIKMLLNFLALMTFLFAIAFAITLAATLLGWAQ